jgi:hypothetical protein
MVASDLAQATGCVTPLHFDPTANWFALIDGSSGSRKHFLLLPQAAQHTLSDLRQSRNTFLLDAQPNERGDVQLDDAHPAPVQDLLQKDALQCLLEPGDSLYIPPRYLHRVENLGTGWNAGMGGQLPSLCNAQVRGQAGGSCDDDAQDLMEVQIKYA